MRYISTLSINRSLKLYNKAIIKIREEKAYQWWLVRLTQYNDETYESFEDFYEKLYPPKIEMDKRSKDEIMNEILGREE